GGIHTSKLALGMARRGHHVVVVTTRCPGQKKLEKWNDISIYRIFSLPFGDFRGAIPSRRTVETILRQEDVNIVHHQSLGILAIQSGRAARSLRIKQIYTYNMLVDHLTQSNWFLRPFYGLLEYLATRFYRQCDFVTFPARKLQADAQKL